MKLCVGLITKNVANYLSDVLKNVERYVKPFKDYQVVIVDGYSSDKTVPIATDWCLNEPSKRTVVTQPTQNLQRCLSLVEARTYVVNYFRNQFAEDVLLLLLDTDSPNVPSVDINGFLTAFKRSDWDAVFANQPTKYYDVWALRDQDCPTDYQHKWYNGTSRQEVEEDVQRLSKAKDPSLGFWPVTSAFGGAGLYKTASIGNAIYAPYTVFKNNSGQSLVLQICEHVPFNSIMVNNGKKLFINCQWLIGDHQEDTQQVKNTENCSKASCEPQQLAVNLS